ncbi:hypothetical protein AVEN_29636-1 [Araneus ventricosus]|uniref:Uncharacterized protein n=1 Tax=Araneus ventricosus TaxID=182803 RepID=A0A4Y2JLW9_ARAVE|nr:hypothetical protein AVEN_29636-1 [Araneus ventricosus]
MGHISTSHWWYAPPHGTSKCESPVVRAGVNVLNGAFPLKGPQSSLNGNVGVSTFCHQHLSLRLLEFDNLRQISVTDRQILPIIPWRSIARIKLSTPSPSHLSNECWHQKKMTPEIQLGDDCGSVELPRRPPEFGGFCLGFL